MGILPFIGNILNVLGQSPRFCLDGFRAMQVYAKDNTLRQVGYLGVFYAVELFNYQLPNIVLKNEYLGNGKDWLSLYLHGGMLLGAIFFSIRIWLYPQKVNKLLNWSIGIHAVGASLTAYAASGIGDDTQQIGINAIHIMGVSRGIFGFGFAAGLGLAMTLIVENFPRSMRTWAATVIGMIGFSGPVIAQMLNLYVDRVWLLCIGGVSSFSILFLSFPKDSELRKTDGRPLRWNDLKRIFTQGETLKLLGICSLLGVSVQFFSDMVSWLPRTSKFWGHDWSYALRYTGFIVGTLWAGALSKHYHQRRKVIFGFIFFQLLLGLAVSATQWWFKGHPWNNSDGHQYLTGALYLFFGVVCGNWMITILQTAEQFSIKERPVMTIIIPNFYRLGTIVIVALNLFYWGADAEGSILASHEKRVWFFNYPSVLFAFWLVFIGASLAASILLKDNFEGDAYEAEYDKKDALNIAGRTIRSKLIKSIKPEVWAARDERPFLTEVNNILIQHLKDCFKGYYVLSSIFYAEDERRVLEYAGREATDDGFDKNTCKRYEIGSTVKKYSPVTHHKILHGLVRSKNCSSLVLWMTEHSEFAGILLYYSGWREALNKDDIKHYRTFDLANIKLDRTAIDKYVPIIRGQLPEKTMLALLEAYFEEYGNTFESSFLTFIYGKNIDISDRKNQDWENGLKKTLLLHRLDASDYGASNYYSYYVNPYYEPNQFRVALLIKTVVQLQKSSLGQVRDLLASIVSYRNGKIYKYNSEQFFRDEDHSTRSMLKDIKVELGEFQIWYDRAQKARARDLPINWNNLEKIQKSLQTAEGLVERLYGLRLLNMALVRYHGGASREELEKKGLPQPEVFHLSKQINQIVARTGLKVINSVHPGLKVKVIEIAMYTILDELIRNATLYARESMPYVHIRWMKGLEHDNYELHIQNNLKVTVGEAQQELLKRMVNDKIYDSSGRQGIATIHRLLRFPWLSSSEKNWDLRCKIADGIIDMYLIIPKEDIEL